MKLSTFLTIVTAFILGLVAASPLQEEHAARGVEGM